MDIKNILKNQEVYYIIIDYGINIILIINICRHLRLNRLKNQYISTNNRYIIQ